MNLRLRNVMEQESEAPPPNDDDNGGGSDPLVSPTIGFQTYDSLEEIMMGSNLVGYFQNLLYYDRGNRCLGAPPGGFCDCPTDNLLLQILSSFLDMCVNNMYTETLDVRARSLRLLIETLLCQTPQDVDITVVNNFLENLSYLVYPSTFYTTDDCQLGVNLERGPERYYGIVRAYHTVGKQALSSLLGKMLSFSSGEWVKLGTRKQYIKTLECVKITGDVISITNTAGYKTVFKEYQDRIYRDRLLLYMAFLKWCVENIWCDNLLAFLYSGYKGCIPKQAFALTLEVAMDESCCPSSSGTVLRFLHSEDAYQETEPSQCPPVYLNMIEAGRGLGSSVDCELSDEKLCLYVPRVYWNLITELQVQCYPGSKRDAPSCSDGTSCSGPVPSYKSSSSCAADASTTNDTRKTIFNNGHTKINFHRGPTAVQRSSMRRSLATTTAMTTTNDYNSSSGGPSTVVFLRK